MLFSFSLYAQNELQVLRAKVVDEKEGEALIGVHVTYADYRYGTATNSNGDFQIKIEQVERPFDSLRFSYIGYEDLVIPIDDELIETTPAVFQMKAALIGLPSIEVEDITAETIVRKANENMSLNYPVEAHTMIGFYREESQQANLKRTILFTEGVLEVQKDKLKKSRYQIRDKVAIIKGYRRKIPYNLITENDTVNITPISQGAYLPAYVDCIRQVNFLFHNNSYKRYDYQYEGIVFMGDKVLYKIAFQPKSNRQILIYDGILYIEKESFAVVKAEYQYNQRGLDSFNENNTTSLDLQYRQFSAQYFQYQGKWYLEQAKVRQAFKESKTKIPVEIKMDYVTTEVAPRERERAVSKWLEFNDVLAASVEAVSEDFWEDYIILKEE